MVPPLVSTRAAAEPASRPRFLDQLHDLALARGHSPSIAAGYAEWARRYILFHDKKHPRELGLTEVRLFLEHVARSEPQPLPTIAVARTALGFLYGEMLEIELGELPLVRPPRLLDQVRHVLHVRHYSLRTEECRQDAVPKPQFRIPSATARSSAFRRNLDFLHRLKAVLPTI
ncbi:MAG TPA: phage integrase N-terminal SAM-like domain-containing protein [Gemmataceae bacterium]|nr:phage integrase N-terminal SAM-like domain-containing protein [Gemmataceae bacterium]